MKVQKATKERIRVFALKETLPDPNEWIAI